MTGGSLSAPTSTGSDSGGHEGGRTICELFQQTARTHAGEPALRTADGAPVLDWSAYRTGVERAARGLAALGVGPGDTVGLMLTNRPEFHILDLAAVHLGAIPFSIYNTSSAEQIEHVLANADCRLLVCEQHFLEQVMRACHPLPAPPDVVVLDGAGRPGVSTLQDVESAGDRALDFERCWRTVMPGQIATIIYTSGTTGPPKGVMLSHANLLAAWESSVAAVPALANRGRYVSYLPAAHLAHRMFSHYPAIFAGSEITCAADPRAAVAQLSSIRPTLFIAVPRIWEKLKDAIEAGIESGLDRGAVRETLGLADADLLVSGAAPINPDVLGFFASLGIEICEGYGMTESTAVATLNLPGRQRFGSVGEPLPGVEVELTDDGEVLLRGPGVMVGYRHDPTQTAEAIDPDGWLHTGDIGRFDQDGYLAIVDRKKELIISAAGKNMSPQNIEAQIKAASPLIAHAIAIGDRRPYNTALIVLDPDTLAHWAQRRGLQRSTQRELARDERLLAEIAAVAEQANKRLSRVEQIKRFTVLDHDWTPGGEQLTPTLKPKRRAIDERYAQEIDAMYDHARAAGMSRPADPASTR